MLKLRLISFKCGKISAKSLFLRSEEFEIRENSNSIIECKLFRSKNSSGISSSCIKSQTYYLTGSTPRLVLPPRLRKEFIISLRIVRKVLNKGLYNTSFLTRRGSYFNWTALFEVSSSSESWSDYMFCLKWRPSCLRISAKYCTRLPSLRADEWLLGVYYAFIKDWLLLWLSGVVYLWLEAWSLLYRFQRFLFLDILNRNLLVFIVV